MAADSRWRRYGLAFARLPATVVRQRYLVTQIARRAFAARHAGLYLGWLWTPLSMVIQIALYLFVFSAILEIKAEGLGIDIAKRTPVGFGVFLVTGMVPFLALNESVVRAARVFRSNSALVQRMRLPAEVLVVGDMAGAVVHHVLSLGLVTAYCVWRGHMLWTDVGWLAVAAAVLGLWLLGLGLTVAVAGAVLPDVPEVLTLGLQVAFFGAPIVYPLVVVPDGVLRTLVELNPVTQIVGLWRTALVGADPPSALVIAAVVAAGLAILAVGAAALERWRYTIADLL